MSASFPIRLTPAPIEFGTDGWRGIIAADFTFERLGRVAPIAAQVLEQTYKDQASNRLIVVGYDRRFLSEEFAEATAIAVQQAGFDVLLADTYIPTPGISWAVKQHQALGGLVITASHNPGAYSGLKVKGAFGGSVPPVVTQAIQNQLEAPILNYAGAAGTLTRFDPWPDYCRILRSKVDLEAIQTAIKSDRLTVYVDAMNGATAKGLGYILDSPVHELRSARDPFFGGGAPEPLPKYISGLMRTLRNRVFLPSELGVAVGFVFDGDGDRIAAVDGQGNFLSSQILIPILTEHLASRRGFTGEFIKTVSGSDLMPKVAELYNLPVFETPIGYKYIADRMLLQSGGVLIGGEESGGIGYGTHIPERDGLLSALYVLEAIAASGKDLSELYQALQQRTNFISAYDRIDLALSSDAIKQKLIQEITQTPFTEVLGTAVTELTNPDGFKIRLADSSWVLIRFSGTEPVLRLYCEAATQTRVHQLLDWAKQWALSHES